MDVEILREIQVEVENLRDADLVPPQSDVEKGEIKLPGAISPFAKRLYTLLDKYDFLVDDMDTKMKHGRLDVDKQYAEYSRLDAKRDLIRSLFWMKVGEEFNAYDKNLGIRKGYIIVELPCGWDHEHECGSDC